MENKEVLARLDLITKKLDIIGTMIYEELVLTNQLKKEEQETIKFVSKSFTQPKRKIKIQKEIKKGVKNVQAKEE